MTKVAKTLYILFGCIMPIFIGALHTYTHLTDLVKPEVERLLQSEIIILGEPQTVWDTWGIVSFMMGMSFIVIGLLNISIVAKLGKDEFPPLNAILAMLIYQASVIYVGYEYEQAFQLYGGVFGLVLALICGGLSLNNKLASKNTAHEK